MAKEKLVSSIRKAPGVRTNMKGKTSSRDTEISLLLMLLQINYVSLVTNGVIL